MPWVPKPREIEAMLSADGKRRYEHFIHRVCDTRILWGLYADGWACLGDADAKCLPLWPHEVYAARFALDDWSAYKPEAINLDDFLEQWIPKLRSSRVQPAIFPVGTGSAVMVSLQDLEANLRHELAEWYGEAG